VGTCGRHHLGHLIGRPDLIELELAKPWQVRCKVCGRGLSNPKSVAKGLGPICAHKVPLKRKPQKACEEASPR